MATIESIGSSTRIEGSKLSDREVERPLSNLAIQSFETRDEQEVAGYAELMDLVVNSWQAIPFNENHVKQLHQILLRHSEKDAEERAICSLREAKATARTESFLTIDALTHYVLRESWQIPDIHERIQEADAGEFATDNQVKAVVAEYSVGSMAL